MKVGFLGFGTINNAVATGLLTCSEPPASVILSPRNAAKAAALAAKFPDTVTVAASNQAVLDACEVVFVAVLPTQAEATLGELTFKPTHCVISLMAGVPPRTIAPWLKTVPLDQVSQCIPLPPVKDHAGVTLVFPASCASGQTALQLFNKLGTAVAVESEDAMGTLPVVTCTMGAYYGLLDAMHTWLVDHGVEAEAASTYVGAQMHSIALDGRNAGAGGFAHLIAEQTPGGYNEQGLREWREAGVFDEVKATMASIAARWQGRAEGSAGRPTTTRGALAAAARAHEASHGAGGGGVLSAAGLALLAEDPAAFDAAVAEAKAAASAGKGKP